MNPLPLKVFGTGHCLPAQVVTGADIDQRANLAPGWTARHTGVLERRFVLSETASELGTTAAREAMARAGVGAGDIDAIVCASGTMEQPIPCNAALLQQALGPEFRGIPSWDVNATCLSFVTAMDLLAPHFAIGKYRKVLIVSSEVGSPGLDWADPETCAILGDGAAAVVVGMPDLPGPALLVSSMKTFGEGARLTEIRAGGSRFPGMRANEIARQEFLFKMDGASIFKLAAKVLPEFCQQLLSKAGLAWKDLALVIPHQASLPSMALLRRRLGIPEEIFYVFSERCGNTIASSIPLGLHFAIRDKRVSEGDKILLIGTSAGFSVGGILLQL